MKKILTSLAAISIIISSMLYTNSVAYYGGYLNYFKLDSDILYRNADQVIYHGFLLTLPQLKNLLLILFFLTVTIVLITIIYIVKFKYRKTKKVFVKPEIFKYRRKIIKTVSSYWIYWPLVLLIAFLLYLGFLAHIESKGKNQARIFKNNIDSGESITLTCASSNYITKLGYSSIMKIFCGANLCVGSTKNWDEFIYFPPQNSSFKSISGSSCSGYKSGKPYPILELNPTTKEPTQKSIDNESDQQTNNF